MRPCSTSLSPAVFAAILVAGAAGCANETTDEPVVASEIGWPGLLALNIESGEMSPTLTAQLAHPIRIHGYGLPLEAGEHGVRSFLLVPDRMYCQHVPPPPPNQLVLVELETAAPWRLLESGIWLTGKLIVVTEKSQFGRFMYKMTELTDVERADW